MMNLILAVYLAVMASSIYAADNNHTIGVSYYDLAAFKELNNTAARCNDQLGTNFTLRSTSFGDWELCTATIYADEIVDKFTDCVDPGAIFPLVFGLDDCSDQGDITFSYEGIVELEEGLTPMMRCNLGGSDVTGSQDICFRANTIRALCGDNVDYGT